jgi:hypothetical protein
MDVKSEDNRGKEFVLKDGNKLFVTRASFGECCDLFKSVSECLRKNGLQHSDLDSAAIVLFCDPEVYRLTFICAKKAIYKGRKIDASLFDDNTIGEAASAALLEIFFIILSFNIERFFPKASSELLMSLTTHQ